jgi:hypothetical protein
MTTTRATKEQFHHLTSLFLAVALFSAHGEAAGGFQSGPSDEEEIQRLLAVVREQGLAEREPETLAKAIERLGELKAKQAIDDLILLLAFKKPIQIDPKSPPIRPIPPWVRYPASGALIKIGRPAVPALVRAIERTSTDAVESENALKSIMLIFRDEPAEAVKISED